MVSSKLHSDGKPMMQPIREILPYHPLFPFILKYRVKGRFGHRSKFHFHDWCEVVFVHEGSGVFFIDPDFYEMSPGDLFAVPGNVIHQTIPSEQTPYTLSVVQFSPALVHQIALGEPFGYMGAFEQRTTARTHRYPLSDNEKTAIEPLLDNMHDEISSGASGYRYAVLALLHQLLARASRLAVQTAPAAPERSSKSAEWMKEMLAYIDRHLEEPLTLSHLADQALVSQAHFSRVFKQMTGLHVPAYLNMKRVLLAAELLARSNLPVRRIAERCRFESPSHFYKTFKLHMDCTPGSYRGRFGVRDR